MQKGWKVPAKRMESAMLDVAEITREIDKEYPYPVIFSHSKLVKRIKRKFGRVEWLACYTHASIEDAIAAARGFANIGEAFAFQNSRLDLVLSYKACIYGIFPAVVAFGLNFLSHHPDKVTSLEVMLLPRKMKDVTTSGFDEIYGSIVASINGTGLFFSQYSDSFSLSRSDIGFYVDVVNAITSIDCAPAMEYRRCETYPEDTMGL